MSGVNKVILVGRLGCDPDVRVMTNGETLVNITIATSESWKDKQTGEKKEKTEWHKIVIFGKLADVATRYLFKGSNIYIEGRLCTEKYEKNGQDAYVTKVYVQGFSGVLQMLDRKKEIPPPKPERQPIQQPSQQLAQKREQAQHDLMDDDIPF